MSFNSTIAVSLTSLFLRHKTQNSYSNVEAKASKIRAGEQTFNLHRVDEEIKCDCQSCCCCCCYLRLSRTRVRVESFRMERNAFSERPFQPRDAEEILSLRRGQDRYNPDEIDCSTRTRIVRDVLLLLRARARASLVLSQPYIFCYIHLLDETNIVNITAHQTANTFDCTIKYFATIIVKTNRANLICNTDTTLLHHINFNYLIN